MKPPRPFALIAKDERFNLSMIPRSFEKKLTKDILFCFARVLSFRGNNMTEGPKF